MSGTLGPEGWGWGQSSSPVSQWDTARMGEADLMAADTANPVSCKLLSGRCVSIGQPGLWLLLQHMSALNDSNSNHRSHGL